MQKQNAKFECARGRGRPAGRVGGAWGRPRPRAHPNLVFFCCFFLLRGFSKHAKIKLIFDSSRPPLTSFFLFYGPGARKTQKKTQTKKNNNGKRSSGGVFCTCRWLVLGTSAGGQQNKPPGGVFASDWWRDHATLSNSLGPITFLNPKTKLNVT